MRVPRHASSSQAVSTKRTFHVLIQPDISCANDTFKPSALTKANARCIFKSMIPQYLQILFWDTNLENFDPLAFPTYSIGRILEYGNEDAIAWLRGTFSRTQIVEVVRTERRLTRRSAIFWALVYGLPPDQVAALKLAP